MGVLLTLISATLSIIFYPVALLYSLFRYSKLSYLNKHYFNIAKSIDQAGNCVCQYLFNDIMIKSGGAEFGNIDESISSVIGKNKKMQTLTFTGNCLYHFLNLLQKNHSEMAVEKDEVDQIK